MFLRYQTHPFASWKRLFSIGYIRCVQSTDTFQFWVSCHAWKFSRFCGVSSELSIDVFWGRNYSQPEDLRIAANAAFVCLEFTLTQWSIRKLPARKNYFNIMSDLFQICIEGALGLSIERRAFLCRKQCVSIEKVSQIVSLSCKLQNVYYRA